MVMVVVFFSLHVNSVPPNSNVLVSDIGQCCDVGAGQEVYGH